MPSPTPADRRPRAVGPVAAGPPVKGPREDAVDLHVRRWAGWEDIHFDADVEAVVTRIAHLDGFLNRATARAVREVGLEKQDYSTLHALLIRDTPGYATTGELAEGARVSNASMTARVDRLERLGLVRRRPSEDDRRVIHVEVTDAGFATWKRAMALRGAAEDALLADLSATEVRRLSALLRKVLRSAERIEQEGS
jgi:DNA-binding MarR family transcriptional regulator